MVHLCSFFVLFLVCQLNAVPVRLPRQLLNLNLGLGSGQPRNDGNTHATVIKGPLGLGTLTISHTHGNVGGTKQPNPSSTGSPVKDPSAPAIHNTTQPDCKASPAPVSGLNINLHFGRPPHGFHQPPPFGHDCDHGPEGYPPPQMPYIPPGDSHPPPPYPPFNNPYPPHVPSSPPVTKGPTTTLSTTTSDEDKLIGDIFGTGNNGGGSSQGGNRGNGDNNGVGSGNGNPTSGSSGQGTNVAEETGEGNIDIRGTFNNNTNSNGNQRPKGRH